MPLAMLPELKRLPNNRIASLVGIALHLRQSDETKFKSHYFGGRSAVHKALYMVTMVATQFWTAYSLPLRRVCTNCLLMVLNARMRDYFAGNSIRAAWFEFLHFRPTGVKIQLLPMWATLSTLLCILFPIYNFTIKSLPHNFMFIKIRWVLNKLTKK